VKGDEKFVKLSAIEKMAMPMGEIHEKMGDDEYDDSHTCPKCGHEWSNDDSEDNEEY
jgi:uncharacterized CHY-type Zn-finger protein